MKSSRTNSRSGIALIIVMVCIAALSILAAAFAYSMKVETKLAMNANNEMELLSLGKSGVALAQWVLAQQLTISQEPYDALNQKWAGGPGSWQTSNSPLAEVTLDNLHLGNGSFSVKIVDFERKMNINRLVTQPPATAQGTLDQAMRLIGVEAAEASAVSAAILDWMDPDKNEHVGGTESDYYEALDPPYHAKDGPIDDLTELLLVRGIADMPEIYWGGLISDHTPAAFQGKLGVQAPGGQPRISGIGLEKLFTTLGQAVNINTAPSEVLQMAPFVDENIAAGIIQARSGPDGQDGTEDDLPFRRPQDALQAGGMNGNVIPQAAGFFSPNCRSTVFDVQVDAQINGYHRYFHAVVLRNSVRDVQVLNFSWKASPPATRNANAR